MINSQINSHQSSYLYLTTVVQPSNVIRVWMWFGCKCKLLHHITASQDVAATSINDQSTRTLFNDTLYLKQCMLLILLRLLHLCTKHMLHNKTLIMLCIIYTNLLFGLFLITCIVSSKQSKCIFIKITSRGILLSP
jgi:hypothetical protein